MRLAGVPQHPVKIPGVIRIDVVRSEIDPTTKPILTVVDFKIPDIHVDNGYHGADRVQDDGYARGIKLTLGQGQCFLDFLRGGSMYS